MYIVAIGWAYVILMMAITASSVGKALAVLVFLGVIPLALFSFVFGRPRRRSMTASDKMADQADATDTHRDQN